MDIPDGIENGGDAGDAGQAAAAPSIPEALPAARRSRLGLLAFLSMLPLGAGIALQVAGAGMTVQRVRVRPGAGIDVSAVFNDSDDLYIKLRTRDGDVKTPYLDDTPIGGGLVMELPVEVALRDIHEVELWDYDSWFRGGDDLVDRAPVDGPEVRGQSVRFEMIGSRPPLRTAGLALTAFGGLCLLLVALRFVRNQVV